ncbi:MAG: AraC family transcriptional regulator [Raineya sp.]|jgi:hypothetical protein|nr:AraC family transcriptional regulator [Raineya sp.]
MLNIIGIFLAIFLAFVLLTKKDKSDADKILSIWLNIIGLHLFWYYCLGIVDKYYQPYFSYGGAFPLLHGPMLYFYTNALTHQNKISAKEFLLHSLPIIIFYISLASFLVLPHEEKLLVFAHKGQGCELERLIRKVLVYTSGIFYVILLLNLLAKHAKNIQNNFSDTEQINLVWLRYLIYSMAIIWLAVFTGNDTLIFSLVAIFVIIFGYFGIKQVGIFTQKLQTVPIDVEKTNQVLQFSDKQLHNDIKKEDIERKTSIANAYLLEIHRKLIELMNQEKPFLNPELTIAELANMVAVHQIIYHKQSMYWKKKLSMIISMGKE